MTRESLELTRDTTRPFLAASSSRVKFFKDYANIVLIITNTGSLPADMVSVEMVIWTTGKDGSEQPLHTIKQDNAIYFPRTNHSFGLKATDKVLELVRAEKTGIRVTMNYQHRITKKGYITVGLYSILKEPIGDEYYFKLDPEKSYWC